MRRCTLLLPLLLLGSEVNAQAGQTGAYVVRQGDVEISRERYWFDGSRLVDTVDLAARDLRLATEMVLEASGTLVEYQAEVLRLSDGSRVQLSEVVFGATVVKWAVIGSATGETPISGPYGMMQNPVFAHLAVTLLRLDPASRSIQELNMWRPEQDSVVDLDVTFSSATTGTALFAGMVMEFETDSSGWLRHVEIPAQGVIVQWVPELEDQPDRGSSRAADAPFHAAVGETPFKFR